MHTRCDKCIACIMQNVFTNDVTAKSAALSTGILYIFTAHQHAYACRVRY